MRELTSVISRFSSSSSTTSNRRSRSAASSCQCLFFSLKKRRPHLQLPDMARGLDEQVAARVVDVSPRHVAEVRGGDARRVLGIPGGGGGGRGSTGTPPAGRASGGALTVSRPLTRPRTSSRALQRPGAHGEVGPSETSRK